MSNTPPTVLILLGLVFLIFIAWCYRLSKPIPGKTYHDRLQTELQAAMQAHLDHARDREEAELKVHYAREAIRITEDRITRLRATINQAENP